jgi:hypothetical protein
MGITADETDRFCAENAIPGSDDINMWAQVNENLPASPEKRGRDRAGTQSTTGSDSHTAKQSRLHV